MDECVLSIPKGSCILVGMETLGQRVKRAMEAQRPPLRGYQLAALLDKQQSYVSKLINDQHKDTPSPEVLRDLERILGIPVMWSLRALGYATEDLSDASASHLPVNSPAARVVEILEALTDEEAQLILNYAEWIVPELDKVRGSASDGVRPKRQAG